MHALKDNPPIQRNALFSMPRLHRRRLLGAGLGATLLPAAVWATTSTAGSTTKGHPMSAVSDVQERSLAELSAEMAAGRISATGLVAAYTQRIQRLDRAGPRLSSVIELNPDALAIAKALDAERTAGRAARPAARHAGADQGQHRHRATG